LTKRWTYQLTSRSTIAATPTTTISARSARELLLAGGLDVDYREFAGGHEIDPSHIPAAAAWLQSVLADSWSS